MQAVREAWTDRQPEDLDHRVEEGFGEIGEELRALRSEIDANQRVLVLVAAGICLTSLVGFLGVIAVVLLRF